jgi:hypothetical protein
VDYGDDLTFECSFCVSRTSLSLANFCALQFSDTSEWTRNAITGIYVNSPGVHHIINRALLFAQVLQEVGVEAVPPRIYNFQYLLNQGPVSPLGDVVHLLAQNG